VAWTFLGANAPFSAKLTLAIELAMGIALIVGAWLARRQRYRQHAWCQSIVVLLNLVVIGIAMIPSLRLQVLPKIPSRLTRSYYALATAHALLASAAELAALYVLLVAGARILPEWLRFSDFKKVMRAVLILWWVALFSGLATYLRWYVSWR
jgi:uncharacterized membrane protein YozB (DUF420 family)